MIFFKQMFMPRLFLFLLILFLSSSIRAQQRPFIWVKANERDVILQKIEQQAWAKSLYDKFEERMEQDFKRYQKNPAEFLKQFPFDWEKQRVEEIPPFKLIFRGNSDEANYREVLIETLQLGIDCGMFYYLTEDEKYAQCALDILNTFVQGLIQIPLPTEKGNQGWIYRENHLYEVRIINAQVPIIYDFVAPFIEKGGRPFDFIKNRKVDFSENIAQQVFLNYAKLAIEQGMTGSNWSILEAPGLVQNTLALNNVFQRDSLLDIYLYKGGERQDPFIEIASQYKQIGDVYPETSQYSNGVSSLTTILMSIISKYKTDLHLGQNYPLIPLALSRWESLKYPNDEIVRFGDGKRYGGTSYASCEIAYYLGKLNEVEELTKTFGMLLNTAISNGEYQRGELGERSYEARAYSEPLLLLWGCSEIEGDVKERIIPRTDNMPHASVFLQRNLSLTGKSEDGLMCVVAGAHMVHGHASGMNIELYGKSQVMGVDHGNGNYRQEIHENYSRIYAAHNTVIVNGSSRSDSGWVNLGINPVQLITMEPMPREEAISPNYSFTTTSFVDDKGEKAEAYQERTLALIRTSKTTGYYVDVFRSKSKLTNEFHDYLYHNIGDKLEFLNNDLVLKPTPQRYMANANLPWVQNRQYRHPGWHYFEEVQTSSEYEKDVKLRFVAENFEKPIFMNLHIPGFENREYTKVMAPKTFESPVPYENHATPTLVIRKNGEAWEKPFVVVYEPIDGDSSNNSILSVEKIIQDGIYKGVKVVSNVEGKKLVQYIITQLQHENFEDKKLGISLAGSFAVVTCNQEGDVLNLYLGAGNELKCGAVSLKSDEPNANAYLDLTTEKPIFKSAFPDKVTFEISK
jgi:hypothetical protein